MATINADPTTWSIPEDVLKEIIDCLDRDRPSLRACALTHSSWLPHARAHLFSTMTILIGGRFTYPDTRILEATLPYVRTLALKHTTRQRRQHPRYLSPSELDSHFSTLAPWLSSKFNTLNIFFVTFATWGPFSSQSIYDMLGNVSELYLGGTSFPGETLADCLASLPNLRLIGAMDSQAMTPIPDYAFTPVSLDSFAWDSMSSKSDDGLVGTLRSFLHSNSLHTMRDIQLACSPSSFRVLAECFASAPALEKLDLELPQQRWSNWKWDDSNILSNLTSEVFLTSESVTAFTLRMTKDTITSGIYIVARAYLPDLRALKLDLRLEDSTIEDALPLTTFHQVDLSRFPLLSGVEVDINGARSLDAFNKQGRARITGLLAPWEDMRRQRKLIVRVHDERADRVSYEQLN